MALMTFDRHSSIGSSVVVNQRRGAVWYVPDVLGGSRSEANDRIRAAVEAYDEGGEEAEGVVRFDLPGWRVDNEDAARLWAVLVEHYGPLPYQEELVETDDLDLEAEDVMIPVAIARTGSNALIAAYLAAHGHGPGWTSRKLLDVSEETAKQYLSNVRNERRLA